MRAVGDFADGIRKGRSLAQGGYDRPEVRGSTDYEQGVREGWDSGRAQVQRAQLSAERIALRWMGAAGGIAAL